MVYLLTKLHDLQERGDVLDVFTSEAGALREAEKMMPGYKAWYEAGQKLGADGKPTKFEYLQINPMNLRC